MGLKIAQKIKCETSFKNTPTTPDITSTRQAANEPTYPTNRHVRLPVYEENNSLTKLHESECLPRYFYDGDGLHASYGDRDWILAKLRRIKSHQQKIEVATQYSEIFKKALDNESAVHRKDGRARFIANSWLLNHTK